MNAVIVYESMFGNTEHIARKVADGLEQDGHQTVLVNVRDIGPHDLEGAELVVVGAPTHAFSLSRRSTREDAVRQGADPSAATRGVREWLTTLKTTPDPSLRRAAAVFDTRVEKVGRLPGSAARRAAKMLRASGFDVLDRPTSFYVADVKGPITFGEFDRAREWGNRLAGLTRRRGDHELR